MTKARKWQNINFLPRVLKIKVYFAHPHSPWERGTNENINALIRQFFPKGTDFSKVPLKNIKRVQDRLNNRPRKTLEFLTSHEVFSKLLHNTLNLNRFIISHGFRDNKKPWLECHDSNQH